jgi:hypothetical protein
MIKEITTPTEVDEILPLIRKGCYMTNMGYSYSGFVAFLVTSLYLKTNKIIVAYDNEIPIGYIVAQIKNIYFENECQILDIYSNNVKESEKAQCYQMLLDWAKGFNCKRITSQTTKIDAIERMFGFKNAGLSCIMKNIEDDKVH